MRYISDTRVDVESLPVIDPRAFLRSQQLFVVIEKRLDRDRPVDCSRVTLQNHTPQSHPALEVEETDVVRR